MDTITRCLDMFCSLSGQKMSAGKTRLLVSNKVNHNAVRELRELSGFALTRYLERYFGSWAKKKEMCQFLLDKTQRRLRNWCANSLSFARRCTLSKAVIAAMPTYMMQTTLLLKQVCNK